MYETSANYKNKIYTSKQLLKIYIDNVEIDSKYILDYSSSNPLLSNGEFQLGSVVANSIEIRLYKSVEINSESEIYITSGISGEEIPIGYFTVQEISKQDDYTNVVKLTDNMLKFDFKYEGSNLPYPCTMAYILNDICIEAGVELRLCFLFKYE